MLTDLARLFAGVTILAFASYTDWRWRRAPNALWLVLAGVALVLLAADALTRWEFVRDNWRFLAIAPGFVLAMYVAWYFGLIAGGADAKALMALALLAPFPLALAPGAPLLESPMPGAFVILSDSLLAFLVIPVVLFALNLARGHFHFPAMILGFKQRVTDLGQGHNWPMETVEEDGKVRMRLFASRRPEDDPVEMRERLLKAGRERVWVTPKIPFMIPLLMGFVAAYTMGDVLFYLIGKLAGAP